MGFLSFLNIGFNTAADDLSLKYDTTGSSGIGWLDKWWKACDRVQENILKKLGFSSSFSTELKAEAAEAERINVAGDGVDILGSAFPHSSIVGKFQNVFNHLFRPDLVENGNPAQEETSKPPNLLQRLFYRKKVLPATALSEQANPGPIGLSQRYEAYPPNEHSLTAEPTPLPQSVQCISR